MPLVFDKLCEFITNFLNVFLHNGIVSLYKVRDGTCSLIPDVVVTEIQV